MSGVTKQYSLKQTLQTET